MGKGGPGKRCGFIFLPHMPLEHACTRVHTRAHTHSLLSQLWAALPHTARWQRQDGGALALATAPDAEGGARTTSWR